MKGFGVLGCWGFRILRFRGVLLWGRVVKFRVLGFGVV